MKNSCDGPASNLFSPLQYNARWRLQDLAASDMISPQMAEACAYAPEMPAVFWGIPFEQDKVICIAGEPAKIKIEPQHAKWLVFLHTADFRALETNDDGFISPMIGEGRLAEPLAAYIVLYEDGAEERVLIRGRHQIGAYVHRWGEMCFQAVPAHKPYPLRASHEQTSPIWGQSQMRVNGNEKKPWNEWVWAWQNPRPEVKVIGLRFELVASPIVIRGISAGSAVENPLRWQTRRKALLRLPEGIKFDPALDEDGLLSQIQLDLGQVISAIPRLSYPNENWESSYNNQLPETDPDKILIEYTAHPQACFHLNNDIQIAVSEIEAEKCTNLAPVQPAVKRVELRVIDQVSRRATAVKLHIHGEANEYLAPLDRHRIVNPAWFEDYSIDFSHNGQHSCTYISGETCLKLPIGKVYIEISKGFEIRPVRKTFEITPETDSITIEIARSLHWRKRDWVTADTHVHFLSPMSALLEGAAEGVNVINLLASQWGELMTNVGDFDGKSTWGSLEKGGEGEYLVRVGTENRQHVLGHISLLGYNGKIITPMTTGGPDESALGDPIEMLLTEWARQCHQQGGLVVLPHFPNPRAECAASIVSGEVDAMEMTSWSNLYAGINPYSLSDWYRYLNCGYLIPAVGGTDKMSAQTAVGTVRTYAHLKPGEPFTYEAWMEAVRRGETFVTYGPLLEFNVEGQPMGSCISLPATGGTMSVTWQAASVTVPMTRVELIVNGEIRESREVNAWKDSGSWSVKADKSQWVALMIRGHYPDQPEIITAHSTPVILDVSGSELFAAGDAVTILEQIEGSLAFIDTIGTRAEDRIYKRMRLALESAANRLHTRMHHQGIFHEHSPKSDHPEHHKH